MDRVANLKFEEIEVGDIFQFTRIIFEKDVLAFAALTGDYNPLHTDKQFGKESQFKQNIVHGMLLGGLFSTLVGMYCPGENNLYLSQDINFRLPVFYGDTVLVRGTIKNKNESIKLIIIKTEIIKDKKIVLSGEAKVKLLI